MHGPNSHTPFLNMYKSVRVKTHTLLYIHTHTPKHTCIHTCMYGSRNINMKKPTVVFRWKTLVSYTSSPGKFVSSVNFCVNFSAHE